MQKISPFLWFEDRAEEAANYYISVFNENPGKGSESKIGNTSRYSKAGAEVSGRREGSVMVIEFNLDGEEWSAINGGPQFAFSGAVSFVINCKTQEEIDHFWKRLGDGGETGQCGWINRDKFGVTWQVVPTRLGELLSGPDPVKSERAMRAMLKMEKLDIKTLEEAYNG